MTGMRDSDKQLLEGLDDAQLQAATALDGPVRIIAVAGAGKTRTITRRIAYACTTGAWQANAALAVTFSVKAAAQMRFRLESLGVGDQVSTSTFHAAALHQLRRVWHEVSDGPFPMTIRKPEDVIAKAMSRVLPAGGFELQECRDMLSEINWAKVSLVAPEDYARVCVATHRQPPGGLEPDRFADAYRAYEREKSARGEIDFHDMLLMMCHIMDDYEEVADEIRARIQWLTVDEYQDISPLQHRLMTRWLGTNRNICVVGDPAQTIYSFAGASGYYLLNFARQFAPLSADVNLATDYRSKPDIIKRANSVLAGSSHPEHYLKLIAVSGVDQVGSVTRSVYDYDAEEIAGVVQRLKRLIDHGARASECAILTRINAQHRLLPQALRQVGLRYRIRSDSGWINSVPDQDAQEHAAKLEALGIAGAAGAVTISTIHAAKGLEFDHVFIIGCSEGLLPYGSPTSIETIEEERRLMYVGVTRARDTLALSYARHKDAYSTSVTRQPSRFL